jgi:hypothetical protein
MGKAANKAIRARPRRRSDDLAKVAAMHPVAAGEVEPGQRRQRIATATVGRGVRAQQLAREAIISADEQAAAAVRSLANDGPGLGRVPGWLEPSHDPRHRIPRCRGGLARERRRPPPHQSGFARPTDESGYSSKGSPEGEIAIGGRRALRTPARLRATHRMGLFVVPQRGSAISVLFACLQHSR